MPTPTNKEIEPTDDGMPISFIRHPRNTILGASIILEALGIEKPTQEMMQFLAYEFNLEIQEAVAEERKAFGGCLNCYGKGYATQMVHAGNSRHGVWELDPIRFCKCERGKQLETFITNRGK